MIKYVLAALLFCGPALSQEKIVLTTANTVTFRGAVDGDSIIKAQLELVDKVLIRGKAGYPIYLVMDSPGGSIYAGEAFIEFAKSIQNMETITIFAASMASAIVQAMPGKRHILGSGIMMFHRAQGQFQGYFETGEVESQLKLWKEIVLTMENRNSARLNIPLKDYKEKVAIEWWALGRGAIEQKMADRLVDIICSPALINETETSTQSMGIFAIETTYSQCPIFRVPLPEKKEEGRIKRIK